MIMTVGGVMRRNMEKCMISSGVRRYTNENIKEEVWSIQWAIKKRGSHGALFLGLTPRRREICLSPFNPQLIFNQIGMSNYCTIF